MQPLVPLVFPSLYPPSFRRNDFLILVYDLFSTNTVVLCGAPFVGEGKERESVVPANLCIVVGCATKRARGYSVVCYIDLEVRRVAGESDEDREVRLQALRVFDPGSVPLELVVSVLVTVVSFTLTCFSSHLIVTGTDPGRGDAVMPIMSVYRLPQGQYGYSGHVVNLPQDVASFVQSLPRLPSELDVIVVREGANQSHRDFRVRRAVVHRALQWLVTHNKLFAK